MYYHSFKSFHSFFNAKFVYYPIPLDIRRFIMNLAALIVGILTVVFTVDDVSAEVNVGKLNVGNIKQELLCTMNIR